MCLRSGSPITAEMPCLILLTTPTSWPSTSPLRGLGRASWSARRSSGRVARPLRLAHRDGQVRAAGRRPAVPRDRRRVAPHVPQGRLRSPLRLRRRRRRARAWHLAAPGVPARRGGALPRRRPPGGDPHARRAAPGAAAAVALAGGGGAALRGRTVAWARGRPDGDLRVRHARLVLIATALPALLAVVVRLAV